MCYVIALTGYPNTNAHRTGGLRNDGTIDDVDLFSFGDNEAGGITVETIWWRRPDAPDSL